MGTRPVGTRRKRITTAPITTANSTKPKAAAGLAKLGSVDAIYRRTLGRNATDLERLKATEFLTRQSESYNKEGKGDGSLVDFAQALLCLNEFVYVD